MNHIFFISEKSKIICVSWQGYEVNLVIKVIFLANLQLLYTHIIGYCCLPHYGVSSSDIVKLLSVSCLNVHGYDPISNQAPEKNSFNFF